MIDIFVQGSRLGDAPKDVLTFVLSAHAYLREHGLTDVDFLDGDMRVIYAVQAGPQVEHKLVAAVLWSEQEDGWWWVELAYTAPSARAEGAMSQLWNRFVDLARQQECPGLRVGVAESNVPMREFIAKMHSKLVPDFVLYDVPL